MTGSGAPGPPGDSLAQDAVCHMASGCSLSHGGIFNADNCLWTRHFGANLPSASKLIKKESEKELKRGSEVVDSTMYPKNDASTLQLSCLCWG